MSNQIDECAEDIMDRANMVEIDYKAGEWGSLLNKVPKGKVAYTALDGDNGQYLIRGWAFTNRHAHYYGDDLGYPEDTTWRFTNFD